AQAHTEVVVQRKVVEPDERRVDVRCRCCTSGREHGYVSGGAASNKWQKVTLSKLQPTWCLLRLQGGREDDRTCLSRAGPLGHCAICVGDGYLAPRSDVD